MNIDELDRMIAERQNRIDQNLADGKIPFEKDVVIEDPIKDKKEEGQRLVQKLRDIEILAMDGVTDEMHKEADTINARLNVLESEIKQLIAEKENAKEE
jgi:hypothetical protein